VLFDCTPTRINQRLYEGSQVTLEVNWKKELSMKSAMSCYLLAIFALLATQPGCNLFPRRKSQSLDISLLKAQGYSIPPGGMPAQVAPDSQGRPRVVLEIRSDERHLESIPMPASGVLFIEDVVQQAKLHEKFGELSISIMRPNGAGAPPVRMDVRINHKGKATNVGQNYALHPDDHIIVLHDERSHLERFLSKTLPNAG
jgi:hypothetical protein